MEGNTATAFSLCYGEHGMDEKRVEELEAEIAELKARWPAHSVPPMMWQLLEELEEQLEEAKSQ